MTQPLTRGAHHVGLSVPDLDAATSFFCATLGYSEVGGNPAYPCKFVSDGTTLITLWQVADPATAIAFDRRRNVGLHHLALAVADNDALALVHDRVAAHPGVTIEFAPGPIREGSATRHFICAMPGGVRIEFATPFA
ncbi:MAG: VOC family protein [Erythrobacter sp.]|jgi:catechol 2,3-dioxygenase-like lactoylglutathione lyase family enzyme